MTEEGGIEIVPGSCFRTWLASVADTGLDDDSISDAWRRVKDHIARRDRADLARRGPPRRDLMSWFLLIAGLILLGLIGFLAELTVLRVTGAAWFLAVGVGIGGLAWVAMRLGLSRRWLYAWLLGSQAVTILYLVAYAASGIADLLH